MARIPKVSRIYPIPKAKKTKTKKPHNTQPKIGTPQEQFPPLVFIRNVQHPTAVDVAKDISLRQLYWLNKGNYKGYKQAKIDYAVFAVKHYDEIKHLTKKDMPSVHIPLLSPFLPFYAIRYARILIMDMLRTKTPAERKLIELVKAERLKLKNLHQ